MNRMRKFVSPRVKHKVLDAPSKIFGVPLDELVRQVPTDGDAVPAAVKKICEHIYKHGVHQEGIFRVSGSARIVDKLKTSFNASGDADLEGDMDIMAVAGLLKLFLRELPDSLVPEHLTQEFIAIQTGMTNKQDYILRLRSRLHSLPEENYSLLKYIMCFLVAVSAHHDVNKMGPMALAIVFGPNVFRCGDGIDGLKDQGTINVLVSQFISEYDQLFRDDIEMDPVETWKQKTKKTPPPRPPPPKVASSPSSALPESVTAEEFRPVPAPRKVPYDSSQYQDGETDDNEKSEATVNNHSSSNRLHSPHFSDEESHGRASPFVLESESLSIIESPMVTARTSELVERTIFDTITERLFGSDQTQARDSPLPSKSQDMEIRDQRLEELATSVRAKVELYERRSSQQDCLPISTLLMQEYTKDTSHVNKAEVKYVGQSDDGGGGGGDSATERSLEEGPFNDLPRDSRILGNMKKHSGPPRRSPSLKFLRSNSTEKKAVDTELTELLEETAIVVTDGNVQTNKWTTKTDEGDSDDHGMEEKEDFNHNNQFHSASMGFLNIHENQENEPLSDTPSPERSPINKHRPLIPPLDFSTLHQNVDGSGAILASNTQSGSWDKKLKVSPDEMNGVPSPRVTKLKKRNGTDPSTDIPPSPPRYQEQYQKQMIDDEYSHRLKQLTKKIQGLKKKVRTFEEEFEQEHGYKPSQGEKAAKPEVKKYVSELSRARKDLKRLREECERGNRSRHGSGASSSGEVLDHPRVEDTLQTIIVSLRDKRQEACRPEDLTLMSRDQVQEEKLAVQKALLHFEGLHGRPNSKEDKDLMRPMYDRYRVIKRMLAKPMSPRNSLELPTVPEDQMMEIPTGAVTTTLFQRRVVHVPTAADNEEGDEDGDRLGTIDFAVTRDFSLLKGTMFPSSAFPSLRHGNVQPKVRKKDNEASQEMHPPESNLHEMNIHELHSELETSRGEKKQLRHHLREFEKGFQEKHGRKVQKEDRAPMQDIYMQYKQVKARLRLLEALVLKHHE